MERPNPLPPLVRPSDLDPARQALVVPDGSDGRDNRPSPFAAVKWRCIPDGIRRTNPPRRPYAGA